MTNNLRHWSALGRTDPAHTKQFQRAGGFKGTAVKPIWTELRMTEHFGPCGIGWGMEKPEYTLVPACEELLVFCTVRLWYRDGSDGEVGTVYGVGGDKVVARFKSGLATSDEAFKAAFTDAIGNAMKHVGIAADVHMGLFDDSKYVRDTGAQFSKSAAKAPAEPADAPLVAGGYAAARGGEASLRGFWEVLGKDQRLAMKELLENELKPLAAARDRELAESEWDNDQNPSDGAPSPPDGAPSGSTGPQPQPQPEGATFRKLQDFLALYPASISAEQSALAEAWAPVFETLVNACLRLEREKFFRSCSQNWLNAMLDVELGA